MMRRPYNLLWIALMLVTCGQKDDPAEDITLVKVGDIPEALVEISGMTEHEDLLWSHNDSGNEPILFGLGKQTLQIERKVVVRDAPNTDWEDISQDDRHLYIGDFGNNLGDRKDLSIYVVNKEDLASGYDTISPSGVIHFSYEDQTDFTPAEEFTTPYDCEAFIIAGDSVLLFTKDWQSQKTGVYSMPSTPGTYIARLRNRANVGGLVTSAAWTPARKELLLLGYADFSPFLVVVSGFDPANPVFKNSRKVSYSSFFGTQTEGICRSSDGSVYVSSEQSALVKATLFKARY